MEQPAAGTAVRVYRCPVRPVSSRRLAVGCQFAECAPPRPAASAASAAPACRGGPINLHSAHALNLSVRDISATRCDAMRDAIVESRSRSQRWNNSQFHGLFDPSVATVIRRSHKNRKVFTYLFFPK